ncbi:class A beta-lactamase [Sphingomonas sp. So64.6b]|uniref:class A beta-lactamase n=1 Tax=Sphingomonas sp. So64.6b TaxID=2997354 RepID=UPI0015FF220F|nr:class A beta-lactamase [Sphingomonas sp. So64.6b]QNA86316.1 class A beta-lactamase [Sphingomonas sp. So64.6b]
MRSILFRIAALSLPLAVSCPAIAAVEKSAGASLQASIAAFEKGTGGKVGFSARHLESGDEVSYNGDEYFPMASTMKVAVATLVMNRVDRGEVELTQMITVEPKFLEQSGPVAESVMHPGISLSVANLLELMLTKSNNTATDMMVRLAGGPAAVTAWLRDNGIKGQNVDHDTHGLLLKFYDLPADKPFLTSFMAKAAQDPKIFDTIYQDKPAFDADVQDSSTPKAMNLLLTKLFSGKLISPASTLFLRGVMERCTTGPERLKGMLPVGTTVAHKTGTLGGSANDVGLITLPGERGHVIISVYVKGATQPSAARDKAIAESSRAAYDYFLYR